MRMFIVSLLILGIIIASGVVYTRVIDCICDEMTDICENIAGSVCKRDISDALNQVEIISNRWDEKEKVLAVMVDHKYLDDVKESIDKIQQNLIFRNFDLAAQNNAVLRIQLTEIHSIGHVSLENIF